MREEISQEEFAGSVNTAFKLKLGDSAQYDLELVSLEDTSFAPNHEQFSLEFRGPAEAVLPQSIYQMEHETIGAFSIFLVPIRRDKSGVYYEAVFNRMQEQKS
ncbi:MAG: hypothetical protein DMF61_25700 [Blastocatellia bacterium AA13]|nr:MAG: hypothetical protein DMF61_25700 [Blastocatellia bacterium AA13]